MFTLAVSLDFLTAWSFWIGVGVIAGIYGIFTLGLQLNVAYTGVFNFGQVGFMAIGAYSMVAADHDVLRRTDRPAVPAATGRLLRDRDDRLR
jgi:ABC-type branched-subunit amino acid transport system permease subunit